MPKRRSNAVESDSEPDGQGTQAGTSKRARFNEQANEHITYAAAPNGDGSKSKKKRARKGDDAEEIDDDDEPGPVNLDDLMESQQAEDDFTTTDRFEQEHEEAIRQSIRNREKLSGVRLSFYMFFFSYSVVWTFRASRCSGSSRPSRCTSSCATSTFSLNSDLRSTSSSVRSISLLVDTYITHIFAQDIMEVSTP